MELMTVEEASRLTDLMGLFQRVVYDWCVVSFVYMGNVQVEIDPVSQQCPYVVVPAELAPVLYPQPFRFQDPVPIVVRPVSVFDCTNRRDWNHYHQTATHGDGHVSFAMALRMRQGVVRQGWYTLKLEPIPDDVELPCISQFIITNTSRYWSASAYSSCDTNDNRQLTVRYAALLLQSVLMGIGLDPKRDWDKCVTAVMGAKVSSCPIKPAAK